MSQIERALREAQGKVDLLCFGEAYLQGFDCLCWDYAVDKEMALELNSQAICQLREWSKAYGTALLTGYRTPAPFSSLCLRPVVQPGGIEKVHLFLRQADGQLPGPEGLAVHHRHQLVLPLDRHRLPLAGPDEVGIIPAFPRGPTFWPCWPT